MSELKKRASHAQFVRQSSRGKDGRYSKMYKCELCNKGLGENYYSDHRVDSKFKGLGLVLCSKDSKLLNTLSDDKALELLQAAEQKRLKKT